MRRIGVADGVAVATGVLTAARCSSDLGPATGRPPPAAASRTPAAMAPPAIPARATSTVIPVRNLISSSQA
jgi:hypothetical protein